MRSFLIVHPAGRTASKTELVAPEGVGVQTCYQRACGYTSGHLGSDNPVLALSRRRCETSAYTSSTAPRFPNMLFSPRLFRSRLVGSPRSPCPELRPPAVAIRFVRDMAHGFGRIRLSLLTCRALLLRACLVAVVTQPNLVRFVPCLTWIGFLSQCCVVMDFIECCSTVRTTMLLRLSDFCALPGTSSNCSRVDRPWLHVEVNARNRISEVIERFSTNGADQ